MKRELNEKTISYRICTPSACCSCSSLEGLQQMISQKSITSPITRIQKITTEDIPLPSFVRNYNESLKQKEAQPFQDDPNAESDNWDWDDNEW